MHHLNYSKLETAARFLASKTRKDWTPELILERLHTLLSNYCEGLGLDTVQVLLLDGHQLQDALTSEPFRLRRPTLVEVSLAADFVHQLCAFDDAATAYGIPLAVVMGNRRLHVVDPIPASAIRLDPRDLMSLANLPEPDSITPYLDLVAEVADGLHPNIFDADADADADADEVGDEDSALPQIADGPIKEAGQPDSAVNEWDRAREIADEINAADVKACAYTSLTELAERVARVMRERGIHGKRGPLTGGNLLREALQGGRWIRKR